MAVSIEDVAGRAGVSVSTVSRVINGRNVVTPATRKRVKDVIDELGYRPNIFARGLMLRKSNILGLALPDLHGEFYSEIIRGANQKAKESGYHLMVSSVDKDDDGKAVLSTVGVHGLVDGVAIMISELDARARETLARINIPFVVLDGPVAGVTHDSVLIDQRLGARSLVQHLVSHVDVERLIYVGGPETNLDTRDRLEACREVLTTAGRTLHADDVHFLDYDYQTAFEFAVRHVRDWSGPRQCVFAANDEMAAGVIHAANAAGLSVPGDLRVVGFDDTRLARIIRPRLTTVHVPMATMGRTVIDLLCQRLADPSRPGAVVTLKSELIVRESCGAESA